MKYLKLFESFVNEELSPELKKKAYDAMMKISKDPNAIDSVKRGLQAQNVLKSVTSEVQSLMDELKSHAKKAVAKIENPMSLRYNFDYKQYSETIVVELEDWGLEESGVVRLNVAFTKGSWYSTIVTVSISKDKYEKGSGSKSEETSFARQALLSDRAFVNTMKKLIVQIQKDEIPGDDPVPAEPSPLTKEGELVLFPLVSGNEPQEDDISKYGTGGSGLPPHTTEAGQIARGR